MNTEDLIIIGVIAIILIFLGNFYFFPDLFGSDESFTEVSPPQTRFFSNSSERLVDDPRYLSFDDPRNSICPTGFFVYGLTTDNKILCSNELGQLVDTNIFVSGVADCPAGQYLYGFNSNGTIDCRVDQTGAGVSENIFTQGAFNKDTNSWEIDLNGGGNNLINIIDVNTTNLYIKTPDLNFFVYDKNIIMQTDNGMVSFFPDENKLCVGSNPNIRACQWLECSGGDCNALFGFN